MTIELPDVYTDMDGDSVRAVSLAAEIGVYFEYPLTEIAEAVLGLQERFLSICGRSELKWYITGTMKRHAKVRAETFGMLALWLAPGQRVRDLMVFELRDGDSFVDTPDRQFRVLSNARESFSFEDRANYLQIVLPKSFLDEKPEEFLALTTDVANAFPVHSGHAGYALMRSPYVSREAYDLAFPAAMRHPGADMSDMSKASYAVKEGGIRGIGWLTILGDELARDVDLALLPKGVMAVRGKTATVLRAGERPAIGDRNRNTVPAAYIATYRLLRHLFIDWYPAFDLGRGDKDEQLTNDWLHRFETLG